MEFHENEVVRLTQEMVRIKSENPGTYDGPFEKEMGDFVYSYLEKTGAEMHRQEVFPGRDNIIAYIPGENDVERLVFMCHMDVVPIGGGWRDDIGNPTEARIIGSRMWGRGSCDMKSGLACSLVAFKDMAKYLKENGITPKHSFMYIATVDEEADMVGADKAIEAGWVTKDSWVLDNEPTEGKVKVSHKGKTWFKITAIGKSAHASIPETGIDAVSGMAEFISAFNKRIAPCPPHAELGRTAATYGIINGGLNINIVPEKCEVLIDMRLVPPIDNKKSIEMAHEAVAEAMEKVPGVTFDVHVLSGRPPIAKDPDSPFLKYVKDAVEKVTGTVEEGLFAGYTDTAVIAATTGNINCISYGPGDLGVAHKPNEYVELDDIYRVKAVLDVLAKYILL